MFYHVSIQQSIDLEPMYFGPKLRDTICLKITDKVGEGAEQPQHISAAHKSTVSMSQRMLLFVSSAPVLRRGTPSSAGTCP